MEEKLIDELISSIKNQKRPETIDVPVYGQYSEKTRTFIYSDADEKYDYISELPPKKKVRSVKAFAQSIKEELTRRENKTGAKATVNINLSGGIFYPDDDFGGNEITFERLNSQQWAHLKQGINRTFDHKQFLYWLKGLKPSFDKMEIDFNSIFSRYNQLKLIGQSRLMSNPIITADGQEEGYVCTYKLEDGTDGQETFPTGFSVKVPYEKAGDNYYEFNIDLLFSRNDNDKIEISILCPEFDNVEEKAIIDEADYIKKQTALYTDLLILSDF